MNVIETKQTVAQAILTEAVAELGPTSILGEGSGQVLASALHSGGTQADTVRILGAPGIAELLPLLHFAPIAEAQTSTSK